MHQWYMHGTCMVVPAYAGLYACSMHGCSKSIHVPCTFHAWLSQSMHVPCMAIPVHAWLFQSMHIPCMTIPVYVSCMHVTGIHAWNVLERACFRCSILSRVDLQ